MTCYRKRMGEGLRNRAIKHIPEELIGDILCNLPVKSMLRFKSVSKSWRSLISSSKFVKDHLNRSNSDSELTHPALIATFYDEETGHGLRSCSLKSLFHGVASNWDHHHPTTGNTNLHFEILGSCNGLVLIERSGLYLWNPSTRKLKTIHVPSSSCPHHSPDHELSFAYGLGYDDSIDDYKVVCITYCTLGYDETHETKIYSVRTGTWKKIDNFIRSFNSGLDCEGKFVNGKLHWIGVKNSVWDIVSLSLVEGQEKYQLVASPKCFPYSDIPKLKILGGYLSLRGHSFSVGNNGMMHINIWVMMEYGTVESWTKIWTLSDFDHPPRYVCTPFWLTKNGDLFVHFTTWVPITSAFSFEDISCKSEAVVVYNGKNKLRECPIGKEDSPDKILAMFEVYRLAPTAYVESLVSPQ